MIKKIFVNEYEKVTNEILIATCTKLGATVYPKVRVADVLSNVDREHFSFALKSHFDFVIVNKEDEPLFVVEVDGVFHNDIKQKQRDQKKNYLCSLCNFPILRINSRYLIEKYRKFSLLSWLIEMWFLREAFFDAQENGLIPGDEIFAPEAIMYVGDKNELFPFYLTHEINRKLLKLYECGRIHQPGTSCWIGKDKDNNYHGISYLKVTKDKGIFVTSAMKTQNFPIVGADLLDSIMASDLYERFFVEHQKNIMVSNDFIINKINEYQALFGGICGQM